MWPEVQRRNARVRHYDALSQCLASLNSNTAQVQDLGYGQPLISSMRPPRYVGKHRAAIGVETRDAYLKWENGVQQQQITAPPEKP